jgi:hypothetical protein
MRGNGYPASWASVDISMSTASSTPLIMIVSMSVSLFRSIVRHRRATAAAIGLVLGSASAFAQDTPPPWNAPPQSAPPQWQPQWQPQWAASPPPPPAIPRLPMSWQSVGVSLGGTHYVESPLVPISFGHGIGAPDEFITRGAWVGIEAQYMIWPWAAVAARGRFGWLRRGPPNRVEWEYPAGTDLRRLDPQLGDSPFGGAAAVVFRFLPKRTALDVGLTGSYGSFRPRFGSHPLVRCPTCYDDGQGAYGGEELWPTLRVSRTGPGFVYAVGTGESFVRTHEPGVLELLFGYRWDDIEFVGGFGRGLAFRIDARVWSSDWVSVDLSMNPWNTEVPGYPSPRSMLTVTFTRRWSSFAPL